MPVNTKNRDSRRKTMNYMESETGRVGSRLVVLNMSRLKV